MKNFTTSDVACAIEVPGIPSTTAVILMRDGNYRNGFAHIPGPERHAVNQWIDTHGDAFRAANRDLLDQEA